MSNLCPPRVPPGETDHRSPKWWRPRRAWLREWARRHTFTIAIAAAFFTGATFETRRKKASRHFAKERRRGAVKVVGVAQRRDTGRPEIVLGRSCPQNLIEHELTVGEVET